MSYFASIDAILMQRNFAVRTTVILDEYLLASIAAELGVACCEMAQ